jgi:hypothetical protein
MIKGFLFDTLKINNEFFNITTSYDKKTAQIKTEFEPIKDLEIKIKFDETKTTENKVYKNDSLGNFFGCLSIVLIFSFIGKILIRKYL